MLRTKSIITDITEVPSTWVFETFLKLPCKLTGQELKMRSVFSEDKTASFCLYTEGDSYKFKDFSTGYSGDCINLVQKLRDTNIGEAITVIVKAYNEYLLNGGTPEVGDYKADSKYKLDSTTFRPWNKLDSDYWSKYKIGSELLDKYNVKPIESYLLKKEDGSNEILIQGNYIYGYLRSNGDLYKIYQPYNKKKKFLKIDRYTQGADQLTKTVPYLVICSSLKDMMAFERLGFKNAEVIAPDSENTLLSEESMIKLKKWYKNICTLLDNDEAGVKAMMTYKEKYNINSVHLKLEKDISDDVKVHGIMHTRQLIYPLLTKALTGELKEL